MDTRTCTQCGQTLPLNMFAFANKKRNRLRGNCKQCERIYRQANRERNRQLNIEWRRANPEKVKEFDRRKLLKHKDKIDAYQASYRKKNKRKRQTAMAKYYRANKKQLMQYSLARRKYRMATDPIFRLRNNVSRSISAALRRNDSKKSGSCLQYLPYTIAELKHHIEKQFEPWMNWDNQGMYIAETWNDNDPSTWKWQLDHIIPQSDLPYTSMTDDNFKKCWSLDNLRPLSAKQNHFDGVRRTRHAKPSQ